jgi:hypothetical protein
MSSSKTITSNIERSMRDNTAAIGLELIFLACAHTPTRIFRNGVLVDAEVPPILPPPPARVMPARSALDER